jgi:hypothetical protein
VWNLLNLSFAFKLICGVSTDTQTTAVTYKEIHPKQIKKSIPSSAPKDPLTQMHFIT